MTSATELHMHTGYECIRVHVACACACRWCEARATPAMRIARERERGAPHDRIGYLGAAHSAFQEAAYRISGRAP